MACRVVKLLKRVGLNPFKWKHSKKKMVTVAVNSKDLCRFLPDKQALRGKGIAEVESFLVENKLFGIRCGVPFIAGLIDGDGHASVRMDYRDSVFGAVVSHWGFAQTLFPFLIDFLEAYVDGLTPNGVSVGYAGSESNGRVVSILKRGREALLSRGITEYSWKVQRWLLKVEKLSSALSELKLRFYSPFEVAQRLHGLISLSTVIRWCRSGHIKHILIRGSPKSKYYMHLIPVEEFRRLESELRKSGDEQAKM